MNIDIPIEQLRDELERTKKAEDAVYRAAGGVDNIDKQPLLKAAWQPMFQRAQEITTFLNFLDQYIPKEPVKTP